MDIGSQNILYKGVGPLVSDHMWEYLKGQKERMIKENDIIRMGKIMLLVKYIKRVA